MRHILIFLSIDNAYHNASHNAIKAELQGIIDINFMTAHRQNNFIFLQRRIK